MPDTSTQFDLGNDTRLRPITVEDADDLFAIVDNNRAYLREWLPWLDQNKSADDTRDFLELIARLRTTGRGAVWAIEYEAKLCGVVGFNWIEQVNHVCEIGYWLSESHCGRGIMTRSVARLVRHAFEDLNINRITIPAAVANTRSRAVPERLGFRAEGVLREAEWLYDHFIDHVLYAMVKSEWLGKNSD